MDIIGLEQKVEKLKKDSFILKGKVQTLESLYNCTLDEIVHLKELQETNKKGIELLNFVQKMSKDSTKKIFENVISSALDFIYQDDRYSFELEFRRRGNIPEMYFNAKTPKLKNFHNIMDTSAGGSRDVMALALRFVLLDLLKNDGLLFLDECFKRLDNKETINRAMMFIKKMQEKTNRQILMISHRQEVVNSVPDPIIME